MLHQHLYCATCNRFYPYPGMFLKLAKKSYVLRFDSRHWLSCIRRDTRVAHADIAQALQHGNSVIWTLLLPQRSNPLIHLPANVLGTSLLNQQMRERTEQSSIPSSRLVTSHSWDRTWNHVCGSQGCYRLAGIFFKTRDAVYSGVEESVCKSDVIANLVKSIEA